MATQENTSNTGVAEKSLQIGKDNSLEEKNAVGKQVLSGSGSNAIGSTYVVKLELPECEKLGTLSSTVEELTVLVSEPIAIEPACVVKMEKAECENLGSSDYTIKEEMGNINLVGGLGSSVLNCGSGVKSDIISGEHEDESSVFDTAGTSSSSSSSLSSGDISGSSSSDDEESAKRSSFSSSSSTSGCCSSSSSSDDEGEDEENMISCGGGDSHDDDTGGPVRSKNEIKHLPPVPPVEVTLEPRHQLLPVGVITSVIGAQVIVEGVEKHDPLNAGSILWMTESRRPLGLVDEIFGPVSNPYYVVRYNSETEVPAEIQRGTLISCVPEFADHVLNNKNLYKKGYDISGDYDEELSNEAEFSDDEKEAEYERMHKTKRGIHDKNPGKRKRKNHRKEVQPEKGVAPPFFDHKICPPYPGIGHGILGPTPMVPQIPPGAAEPDTTWIRFPQPSSVMLPNGLPTPNSHQFPAPGIPYQQQIDPSQGSLPTTLLPRALPMYAQGLVGQNQMTLGLSSHLPQIQPSTCTREQGYSNGLQSGSNDLHSSSVLENQHAPRQCHPWASASQKREAFHRGGR